MKQSFPEYYVGLDLGTSSVGWAVTDKNYQVLRFNRKSMWGVRRFEAGETAADRRMKRSQRRGYNRRKFRLNFLREQFAEAIAAVDPDFFTRLDESFLHLEDKTTDQLHVYFNDPHYTDQDYFRDYPTIYHLRKALIDNTAPQDSRLVYLAIHHLMKYRGHFLIDGEFSTIEESVTGRDYVYQVNSLTKVLFNDLLFSEESIQLDHIESVLTDGELTKPERLRALNGLIHSEVPTATKKYFRQLNRLLSGSRVTNITNIFPELELEEKVPLEVTADNFLENVEALGVVNPQQLKLLEYVQGLHDWGVLEILQQGEPYLSYAKVNTYEEHGRQLQLLKDLIATEYSTDYADFFHNSASNKNYPAYIGQNPKKATREVLYREINRIINQKEEADRSAIALDIQTWIAQDNFLIKPRNSDNAVIPRQLHQLELVQILDHASKYLPFLQEWDAEAELTTAQKIIAMFQFRIPYYIGPLNDYHSPDKQDSSVPLDEQGTAWVVRKRYETVYPWNFTEQIDVPATAERFIDRMTNQCTYLTKETVLAKSSLLYEKYMVLNELNNLRIDGKPISVAMKQHLFEDKFVKEHINVTVARIITWLKDNKYVNSDENPLIGGIDQNIKHKLTSYHDMKRIFGKVSHQQAMIEDIIHWLTVFEEDSTILEDKINEVYPGQVTAQQIKQLKNLPYAGWGRLSRKLLEEIVDDRHFGPESRSIIQALYHTNYNLNELLVANFDYLRIIEVLNGKQQSSSQAITIERINDLYVSPAVRKSIWQTARVMDEIIQITGKPPQKIFLEVTREHRPDQGQTDSRKQQLLNVYRNLSAEANLLKELESYEEHQLRRRKLYLYFTQLGRCMYTNERIPLGDLLDNIQNYEVDHIIPRSLTKDDSFNNLVLVKWEANQKKKNLYPLPSGFRQSQLWRRLYELKLISKQKYERLIRPEKEVLQPEELSGFIARQLVETSQSIQAVAGLFKAAYPESTLVYVKARHVSDFRHQYANDFKDGEGKLLRAGNPDFWKLRSLNEYHHAKDAYLNIVVGNVYHTKFTANPANFMKGEVRSYNLTKLYDKDVIRKDQTAWIAGDQGTIQQVTRQMSFNNILLTSLTEDGKGSLFNETRTSSGAIPLKKGLDPQKYGGYTGDQSAYYVLVETTRGQRRLRLLKTVPLRIAAVIRHEEDLLNFLKEEYALKDPRIVVPHIPYMNALISYDGIKGRITGSSGSRDGRYLIQNETQPLLNVVNRNTYKKIENYQRFKFYNPNVDRCPTIFGLTGKDLMEVYEEILTMTEKEFYQNINQRAFKLLHEGQDKFNNLDLKDKITLILESLKFFQSSRSSSSLQLIDGSRTIARIRISENFSSKKAVYLYHQSVTGLFEHRVNLLSDDL